MTKGKNREKREKKGKKGEREEKGKDRFLKKGIPRQIFETLVV